MFRFVALATVMILLASCSAAAKAPQGDLSLPDRTIDTFMHACLRNDTAAVENTLYATGQFRAFRDDLALWMTSQTRLDAAILHRFGRDTHDRVLADWSDLLSYASVGALSDAMACLPSADVDYENNRARMIGGPRMQGAWVSSEPIWFIKVGDRWEIDLDAIRKDPDCVTLACADHYPPRPGQNDVSMYAYDGARRAAQVNQLAAEVEAGRIGSVGELQKALAELQAGTGHAQGP